FNFAELNDGDVDVGSAGTILLGDETGSSAHPRLMIAAGKEGRIYLLDPDNNGHWQQGFERQIVATTHTAEVRAMVCHPAYFNHSVYFCGAGDPVKAYSVYDAVLSKGPSSQAPLQLDYPGCLPTISANGTADAIVWILDPGGILRAYDAHNLANEFYNSNENK